MRDPHLTCSDEIERCGFVLSMLVEKHSKQKTPGNFYAEALPRPYSDLQLDETEYRETVVRLCDCLRSASASIEAKRAVLFAIGGTDDRTLVLTIPALVDSLSQNSGQEIFDECSNCLARMLSSPQRIREQAELLHQALPNLEEIIQSTAARVGRESARTLPFLKLQNLLRR